jgi:hypothetical protein
MYTYRKQVIVNASTPANTSGYVVYELDINNIAQNKMADVEIISSLNTGGSGPNNTSTIYYRKLQLVNQVLSPDYIYYPINSSFTYVADIAINLYLSEILYDQSTGNIQIKTTNPTGDPSSGICFIHFKINFY